MRAHLALCVCSRESSEVAVIQRARHEDVLAFDVTLIVTPITVDGIVIVTRFAECRMDQAVAAEGNRAPGGAEIVIARAIVALFASRGTDDAITATGSGAAVRARISGVGVCIVALFTDGSRNDTIAAEGEFARARALTSGVTGAGSEWIAPVTLFASAGLDVSIPTRGELARIRASIGHVGVAVVAGFARLLHAIAAAGSGAIVGARVVLDAIPIVTSLVCLGDAVAAARRGARIRATVVVDGVPVVADFARLRESVTARCRTARRGAQIRV